jgi:hypothetical protein
MNSRIKYFLISLVIWTALIERAISHIGEIGIILVPPLLLLFIPLFFLLVSAIIYVSPKKQYTPIFLSGAVAPFLYAFIVFLFFN